MKKLPIGLQDFGELRKGDYLYIDKTELIYQLVTQGKYYRPNSKIKASDSRIIFSSFLFLSGLLDFMGSNALL